MTVCMLCTYVHECIQAWIMRHLFDED